MLAPNKLNENHFEFQIECENIHLKIRLRSHTMKVQCIYIQ